MNSRLITVPFIIAEMSGNHNGLLDRANQIVDAAANAGVGALKLQTYTPDTMTLDSDREEFMIADPDNHWSGNRLYDLYDQAQTSWEWHEALFKRCRERNIIPFSSPFDDSAVDFLESLDCPLYKIASFEIVDLPLIRKVASTGKPLIISTGMATLEEIQEAVDTARQAGCSDLTLLKCTSSYPASAEDSHLLTIPDLQRRFDCRVGISDHTRGIGVSLAAVGLGATVIEKHFTLSRSDGGIDADFSMEPHEMAQLVEEANRAYLSLGQVKYGPSDSERPSLAHRRSLYIGEDLKAGDILTSENIRRIRPGNGLAPKYYDEVIGKRVNRDIERGTPLSWDLLDD